MHIVIPRQKNTPILGGSAIVASFDHERRFWKVYWEGAVYDFHGCEEISERLIIAAGRLKDTYPSVARGFYDDESFDRQFLKVGYYDYATKTAVIEPEHADAWSTWLAQFATRHSQRTQALRSAYH